MKFISVKKIHFIEVNFNHEAPENPSQYYALFKSPVNFDAGETSLVIDSAVADHVLPLGPQSLGTTAGQYQDAVSHHNNAGER